MIEIRIMGDAADVVQAEGLIRRTSRVTEESGAYVDRRGAGVRVYLTAAGPARVQGNEYEAKARTQEG